MTVEDAPSGGAAGPPPFHGPPPGPVGSGAAVDVAPAPGTPGWGAGPGGPPEPAGDPLAAGPRTVGTDVPRNLSHFSPDDAAELVGSAIAALALTWLVFFRMTPLYGTTGFVLVSFVVFIAVYWVVVRQNHGRLAAGERVAAVVMAAAAVAAVVPLGLIIWEVVREGITNLRPNFFTETQQDTGPLEPATAGGAAHAIVGTLQQVALAMVISVPLAVLTAVFVNEIGGRFARFVRFVVDTMSGTPSIVAGLFIYSIVILQFDRGYSGFAGSLALVILMLPTVTRTTEEMLRLVSSGLREAALALGAPEWRVTMQVVLPTARTGIVTAVILGVARAIGETAPVLLTTFGASVMNWNPFAEPQSNLPLFVYSGIRSSFDTQVERAWTGAFVLMAIVLVLFVLARLIGGRDHLRR